jgi:Na+/proline symporter
MSSVYFWVILAYLVFLVAVGALRSGKVETQEDFSVAGRQLSTFVLFGTMLATWIGTGSIFGNAERVYEKGIAAWIIPLGSLVVSYQYRAAAAVINLTLPDLDFRLAVIICAAFIIIYTALAGMFSVAYTDLAMGVTMIIGILVTLPYVFIKAGSTSGMAGVLPPSHMEFFGPKVSLRRWA